MSTQADDAETLNHIFSPAWQLDLLAPGRKILHTLDTAFRYFEHTEFPQEYTVEATYRDATARKQWRWRDGWIRKTPVECRETFHLSFAQWSKSAMELDQAAKVSGSLARSDRSLAKMKDAPMFPKTFRQAPRHPKNESVKAWLERQR